MELAEVIESLRPLGFERMEQQSGATYRDCSTVLVTPVRTNGEIHWKVCSSWQNLIAPMNQKRGWIFAAGDEVGRAYNRTIERVLTDQQLSKWKYVLTIEDDNLPPPDGHVRLLESIELGPFDAVGGLYWTKGEFNMPMAYGDPAEFSATGVLNFRPRSVIEAVRAGRILEVNGVGMGFTLWRMELFRQMSGPWFVTIGDVVPEKGPQLFTQDLYFCERARRAGKRFAVDCRCTVGHIDRESGIVY